MPRACYLCQKKEFLLLSYTYKPYKFHLQMCLKRSSAPRLHCVKCEVPIKEVNTGYANDTMVKCVLRENAPSSMWYRTNTFIIKRHLNRNSKKYHNNVHTTERSKRNYAVKFTISHRNSGRRATARSLIKLHWALRNV